MALVQGIDVGTWRVRVATMEGSFRRFVLRDVTEMESSVGLGDAVEAIRAQDPSWEQAERVAAFPLEQGAMRVVTLPFVDRATVAKALPAEVESSVPYDLEDMVLATQLIDAEKGRTRTRVVIAPREAIRERLDALRAARAEPRGLVLDAEALASYATRGVQAVVDVGHERTLLALVVGGQLHAARLVPLGGKAMTEAIAEALGVPLAEAEALKHASAVPVLGSALAGWSDAEPTDAQRGPSPSALAAEPGAEAALLAVVDELVAEVRARLIALEDQHGVGVDEVLLAGGGAQLTGFVQRFAQAVGVSTRPVVVPGGHPLCCALAVALARNAAEETRALDLRVGEFAYRGHAEILWGVVSWGALGTAAAVFLALGVGAYRLVNTWGEASQLDDDVADVVTRNFSDVSRDRLADTSTALAIFTERANAAAARVELLGPAVSSEPPLLTMLVDISQALPPNAEARIDVRELNISADAVSFKAETDSYDSAAKIEEALKGTPRFAQARKSEEKKAGDGLTFNVSIPLGEAPAADADAKTPATPGKEG